VADTYRSEITYKGGRFDMKREGVYLAENGTYVGPFGSRGDAQRFILLMELSGEDPAGIEIVDIKDGTSNVRRPRTRGLARAERSKEAPYGKARASA
jgi:hypothetical protein